MTAQVWLRLLVELRRDREIDLLADYLPVVAASILLNSPDALTPDEALIVLAGARSQAIGEGNSDCAWSLATIESLVGEDGLEALRQVDSTSSVDDERWQTLLSGWRAVLERFVASEREQTLDGFLDYLRVGNAERTRANSCRATDDDECVQCQGTGVAGGDSGRDGGRGISVFDGIRTRSRSPKRGESFMSG